MKGCRFFLAAWMILGSAVCGSAHFDMLIGDKPWVDRGENATFRYYSGHPFEAEIGDRERPVSVTAVREDGDKEDLSEHIEKTTIRYEGKDQPQYVFTYAPKRSGDVILSVQGAREFWENTCSDSFCKLVLHCRRSVGWDRELGHPVEIVPYTRPYGIRAGSVFCGKVKVNGEPAEGIEIEFEEFNESPPDTIPPGPLVTGIVKTDNDGNFQITLDREGWWGIAAHATTGKIQHEGKTYDREVSALFWVYVHPGR